MAWGEYGVVSVKHSKRYRSAELPVLDRRVKPPMPEVDPGFEDTDNEEPEIETDKDVSVIVDDSEATVIPGF